MKNIFILVFAFIAINIKAQTNSLEICRDEVFKENQKDAGAFFKLATELHDCLVGKLFPSFEVKTLNGNSISLNDLRGKVVLLNFWFIGCQPCVAEMPLLEELSKTYSKDFVLLSFTRDGKNEVEKFFKEHKVNIETVADANELIQNSIKMTFGYPSNFFLNKKGEIIEYRGGGAIGEAGLERTKKEFAKIIEGELKK